MAARVAQYVTVIDRSNKVIGNSRQFKDVFVEAKAAYQERKAEIKAKKKAKEEEELQKAIRAVSIQDQTERGSTVRPDGPRRRSTNRTHTPGRGSPPMDQRPRTERMQSNASARSSGNTTPREGVPRGLSLGEFNDQIYGPQAAPWEQHPTGGLVRAQTDQPLPLQLQRRPDHLTRSQSVDDATIDLDLAYGEYHPESLVIEPEEQRKKELNSLVVKCKGLLDEADCAGHSAKAIIEHLQKNPDTLAAVGLTLAEISSVASKMAPGALAAIGKSAPAVMALLMSPQFLIAVGVGVGVTVIAIGGFKIIKKIKERSSDDEKLNKHVGPGHEEAIDVRELDRIEQWRRGVPESVVDDTGSIVSGTTVEGEFITPFAAQSMGHLPPTKSTASGARSKSVRKPSHSPRDRDGHSRSKDRDRDTDSQKSERKKKHRKHRSDGEDNESVTSKDSQSTLRRSKTSPEKSLVKVKKLSPLSRMFTTGSTRS